MITKQPKPMCRSLAWLVKLNDNGIQKLETFRNRRQLHAVSLVAWLVAGGWYRPHSSAVTQIVALASLWGIYGEELGRGRGLARGGEDESGGRIMQS